MVAAITTDNYGIRDKNKLSDHVHGLDNRDEIVVKTPVRQIAFTNISTQEIDERTLRKFQLDSINSVVEILNEKQKLEREEHNKAIDEQIQHNREMEILKARRQLGPSPA